MELGLGGRPAIITGASKGIGAATARALASEGARVALVARNADALAAVARSIGGASIVVADLSTADGVRRSIAQAIEQLGGVDILVNNAGSSRSGSFDEVSDTDWEDAFALKVMGYIRCMRAVLPAMRAQHRGRIINIGGTAGLRATPAYSLAALNAALIHLTRSTAELVAGDGIGVVSLHPGPTLTDRMRTMIGPFADAAGLDVEAFAREHVAPAIPLGRVGTEDEVAAAIVFLASERAEFITGGGLSIDGGAATGVVGG
jgi:NAD(P)-dependent dehydrogenase (short-subunit alcohol dehydrogenase family)